MGYTTNISGRQRALTEFLRTTALRGRSLQRVAPLELGKSRKVTIGRHERAAVLDGERREVRIRGEAPDRLSLLKQCLQHCPVALGGMDQPYARLIEPALYAAHGLIEIERSLVDAGIGADANERT